MGHASVRKAARYGTPVRCRVQPEVAQALLKIAKRDKRTVDHVASTLLESWHEVLADDKLHDALAHAAQSNQMSVAQVIAAVLGSWYSQVYKPSQKGG